MSKPHTRSYRMQKLPEMRARKLYTGYVHYGFTFGFALAIGIFSVSHLHDLNPVSLLVIPFIILYANFVEYFTHRWPLHHQVKGLGILFDRHAIQHHQYFTDHDMTIKSHYEMFYVLFPAIAIVFFIPVMAGPLSYLMGYWFGENVGWLTLATAVFYFAWYETFHLANHLPKTHFLHRIPGLSSMCRFHLLHHHPAYAKNWNFNVTFPFADWVMGTLKRK
jgi:hypothetical protein